MHRQLQVERALLLSSSYGQKRVRDVSRCQDWQRMFLMDTILILTTRKSGQRNVLVREQRIAEREAKRNICALERKRGAPKGRLKKEKREEKEHFCFRRTHVRTSTYLLYLSLFLSFFLSSPPPLLSTLRRGEWWVNLGYNDGSSWSLNCEGQRLEKARCHPQGRDEGHRYQRHTRYRVQRDNEQKYSVGLSGMALPDQVEMLQSDLFQKGHERERVEWLLSSWKALLLFCGWF